jgi:hypothetical protein
MVTSADGTESLKTRRKEQSVVQTFVPSSLVSLVPESLLLSLSVGPGLLSDSTEGKFVPMSILTSSVCRYLCGLAVDPCGRVVSLCTTPVISASSVTSPAARYVHRLTFQWRLVTSAR